MAQEPSEPGSIFEMERTLPDPLPSEPFSLFTRWFDEARERGAQPNPNAVYLATVDEGGAPSVRTVLCKRIAGDDGYIVFFTNYESRKGRSLEANPVAGALFHWDDAEQQVRIEGRVVRSPPEESDEYFASRHWVSRIGAWASRQSRPLDSREQLMEQVGEAIMELGVDVERAIRREPVDIPRPPHWGGYRLWAERVELWLGGPGRVHDRALWSRSLEPDGDAFEAGPWSVTRLQP